MQTEQNNKLANENDLTEKPIINETVTSHMLRIFGNQAGQYVPTQSQVDKILALQEKGMDYTHHERTNSSPKQKAELIMFMTIIGVMVIIFILSLFFAKEYLSEIISGTAGFLAGGAGGYGFAKSKNKNNNDE